MMSNDFDKLRLILHDGLVGYSMQLSGIVMHSRDFRSINVKGRSNMCH